MTTIWRCCKWTRLGNAFEGTGGLHAPGRWHQRPRPIIYASEEASLSVLERLVHGNSLDFVIRTHVLASATLPDRFIDTLPEDAFPKDWNSPRPTGATQRWGDAWLDERANVAVRVPSAVMPGRNILINPQHPDFPKLVPHDTHHAWDPRLIERTHHDNR